MSADRLWSMDEIQILTDNYLSIGSLGCAPLLPLRTREMIRAKAANLGISKTTPKTDLERFESKFRVTPGCWIWTGGVFNSGYGQFKALGQGWRAHRYSYTQYIGPIADDLCVCHRCDVPLCVNPDHLFLGTNQENTADRVAKGRTNRSLGEQNKVAKLTKEDVWAIRAAQGSHSEVAKLFGICSSNVCLIKSRKSWAHLGERSEEAVA